MEKQLLSKAAAELVRKDSANYISAENAISPELEGMKIFDEPLVGVASASDHHFIKLKEPDIIGEHFILPTEWLEGAQSVVSLFFPFSDIVKSSNRMDANCPSNEWLHARIEGQVFLNKACTQLKQIIETENHSCVIPPLDKRFSQISPYTKDNTHQDFYTSNWSERHVAYICGIGTFGLSKGLITKKGIAGRFASFITDAKIDPDTRPYTNFNEYCSMCGACINNCPVNAISFENGKLHPACSNYLDETEIRFNPRYGCGKCQVNVPCESQIPIKIST